MASPLRKTPFFTFCSVNNLRRNYYFPDGALFPLPPPDGLPVVLGQLPPLPLPPPLPPLAPPPLFPPLPPPCEPPLLIIFSFSLFCFIVGCSTPKHIEADARQTSSRREKMQVRHKNGAKHLALTCVNPNTLLRRWVSAGGRCFAQAQDVRQRLPVVVTGAGVVMLPLPHCPRRNPSLLRHFRLGQVGFDAFQQQVIAG